MRTVPSHEPRRPARSERQRAQHRSQTRDGNRREPGPVRRARRPDRPQRDRAEPNRSRALQEARLRPRLRARVARRLSRATRRVLSVPQDGKVHARQDLRH